MTSWCCANSSYICNGYQQRVVDVPGVSMELCGGTSSARTWSGWRPCRRSSGAAIRPWRRVRGELAGAKAAALAARTEALGAIPAGSARAGEPFALLVERALMKWRGQPAGAAQGLVDQLGEAAAVVLGGLPDPADAGKVLLVAAFGAAVIAAGPKPGAFIGTVAKACGGGVGRPNLAQARGQDGAALDGALAEAKEQLREQLGVALG
jgi:alanyl-tRNA synthetase